MANNKNTETMQLSRFLSACGGNWRNAVYIFDVDENERYLMTADRDGIPVLMEYEKLCKLIGVSIDPDECCARMGKDVFETVYAQYLLWHLTSRQEGSLSMLCMLGDAEGEAETG